MMEGNLICFGSCCNNNGQKEHGDALPIQLESSLLVGHTQECICFVFWHRLLKLSTSCTFNRPKMWPEHLLKRSCCSILLQCCPSATIVSARKLTGLGDAISLKLHFPQVLDATLADATLACRRTELFIHLVGEHHAVDAQQEEPGLAAPGPSESPFREEGFATRQ